VRRKRFDDGYKHSPKRAWEFSQEQLKDLFLAFRSLKYRVLFRLQFLLALRIGEVISLRWEDIDFSSRKLALDNSKTRGQEFLPLSDEALCLLRRWRFYADGEFVFPAERVGGHVSYVLCDRRFKQAVRRAGLPEWGHPHCLRHTRLSQFYRHTKNWELTRMFARHVSAKTTFDYYVHASLGELESALQDFSNAKLN